MGKIATDPSDVHPELARNDQITLRKLKKRVSGIMFFLLETVYQSGIYF